MQTQNNFNIKNMTFSQAIAQLKFGKRVARSGWNGKGMYVYLEKGTFDFLGEQEKAGPGVLVNVCGIPPELFNQGIEGCTTRLPCFVMHTAQGNEQPGWLASQSDMLAEDWETRNDEVQ